MRRGRQPDRSGERITFGRMRIGFPPRDAVASYGDLGGSPLDRGPAPGSGVSRIHPDASTSSGTHYLTHPTASPAPASSLFAHVDLRLKEETSGSGRGAALRFMVDDVPMVFKDYHRGGLPARVIRDTYAGIRLEATRMWREFRLLAQLEDLGLPVPTPIAARCTRHSPLTYRGDLITRELPGTTTIAACIAEGPLPAREWRQVGRLIRRFHDHGVYHADLNAHNILRDGDARLFLLDFDKGRIRRPSDRWKQANLDRLGRSLAKLTRMAAVAAADGRVHFSDSDWRALLDGYNAFRERGREDTTSETTPTSTGSSLAAVTTVDQARA